MLFFLTKDVTQLEKIRTYCPYFENSDILCKPHTLYLIYCVNPIHFMTMTKVCLFPPRAEFSLELPECPGMVGLHSATSWAIFVLKRKIIFFRYDHKRKTLLKIKILNISPPCILNHNTMH